MTLDSRCQPLLLALSILLAACAQPHISRDGTTLYLDEATGGTKAAPSLRNSRGRAQAHRLVEIRDLIPGISIDLRYATAENVAKRPLYPRQMPCLLRRETALKLKEAHETLRAQGYGLRVWDAYRPPEVQEVLHRAGADTHMFISPETMGWSRHCGGISVDVTLVDAHGNEQRMPTGFDAGLRGASAKYQGGDAVIAHHLQLLQRAMLRAGFTQARAEWWHFDDGEFVNHPQPVVFGRELAIPAP